ncbi:MAG: chaperone modulator CbpM [Flavobacteriales bacterium]
MEDKELIPVEFFCTTSHVEVALLETLEESGLVKITVREEHRYIAVDELGRVEKLVRLHDDLGINVEGLEAIDHMLQRVEMLQEEMRNLRNRLRRYEAE